VGHIAHRFEDVDFGGEEGFVDFRFEHFEVDDFDGDGLFGGVIASPVNLTGVPLPDYISESI
jgi:hypothetical protein